MKKSKHERIKRLKKKRIWPSILGLAVITGLFAIVLALLVELSIYDVLKRKIMTTASQTKLVVDMFEVQEQGVQAQLMNYIDLEIIYYIESPHFHSNNFIITI